MADLRTHCNDCLALFGDKYSEVHEWLDASFNEVTLDVKHRDKMHNLEGIKVIFCMFGGGAAKAAIAHILRDKEGVRPLIEDVETWLKNGIPTINWSEN